MEIKELKFKEIEAIEGCIGCIFNKTNAILNDACWKNNPQCSYSTIFVEEDK